MRSEAEAVFLFIAELTGSFKAGSGAKQDKIVCGQMDYINAHFPELNLDKEEDRKDLHEKLWLERLYNELDQYFNTTGSSAAKRRSAIKSERYRDHSYKWTVPVEIDASASLLQYQAILLNDRRLMEMTNLIGDTLQDPWKLEGISRNQLKKAMTPMLTI